MEGYSVKIVACSQELSAKERIQLKDTTGAVKLDTATQEAPVIITPVMWAELSIHNENSKNEKDYANYIVVDATGERFITGSQSFWSSFKDIYDEMQGETEEWAIRAYRLPSKNRSGKDFITCSIM